MEIKHHMQPVVKYKMITQHMDTLTASIVVWNFLTFTYFRLLVLLKYNYL